MMTRQLRSLVAVGFFLAVFIAEVWQAFARVGSLVPSDAPTGRRTAGCPSISVEPRATRLEKPRLPVTSRVGRPATILAPWRAVRLSPHDQGSNTSNLRK
jgi:hypothetical protein